MNKHTTGTVSPFFNLRMKLLLGLGFLSLFTLSAVSNAACPTDFTSAKMTVNATPSTDICPVSAYIKVIRDATYNLNGGTQSQKLDLYVPTSTTQQKLPLVIWVHGGGWSSGDKSALAQTQWLLCEGYALASIEYRPSPLGRRTIKDKAIFPAQIYDVKAAIRYLRVVAADYNLDPNKFVIFGSSAGGHLASLAGVSTNVGSLEDLSMGNENVSSRVQGVIDWYGPTDFLTLGSTHDYTSENGLLGCDVTDITDTACRSLARKASPASANYIDINDPPFLIMHGSLDPLITPTQSKEFFDVLNGKGVCVKHREVIGLEHGGDGWLSTGVRQVVLKFLTAILK